MQLDDLDDNSELGAFRLRADIAFMQMVAETVWKECPDRSVRVEANRRYLRITKSLPSGKQAVLHGHLTWSEDRGDHFLIESDSGETYVESETLTPRRVAAKLLEILSQLTDTA